MPVAKVGGKTQRAGCGMGRRGERAPFYKFEIEIEFVWVKAQKEREKRKRERGGWGSADRPMGWG